MSSLGNNGMSRRSGRAEPDLPEDEISSASEQQQYEYECHKETKTVSPIFRLLQMVVCIVTGIIFGIAMEKGRVFEPRTIRHQMVFKKMIMLKMFLSALATGMFCLALTAMIPGLYRRFYHTCNKYFNSLSDKGVLSSIIGGSLLGIGMTISGSCPTSIYAQLGAMVPNSSYTLAGGLVGALAYGILKPFIDVATRTIIKESSNPWLNSPYFIMALPIAAMFGVVVCSFEILVPWTREVKIKDPEADMWVIKAWPPYVTGMIIGCLQIPLMIMLEETLGGSTSFTVAWAQVLIGPLKRISPYIARHRWGMDVWWQIFFVCGAIYGAYLSASMSGFLGSAKGVPPKEAFIGGFLIIFGARIAGGCTSGHGLSGMSLLSIISVLTTACMFSAAIITAFIMQHMGTLKIT